MINSKYHESLLIFLIAIVWIDLIQFDIQSNFNYRCIQIVYYIINILISILN